MRGLTRRWLFRDTSAAAPDDRPLASLRLPPLVERVLVARGMRDADTVRQFCEPKLTDLVDPMRLPGVEAAAERLVRAVRGGERIVIYGDYDVDGITATAILYHVVRSAAPAADIHSYVPHRVEEGYGLSADALRRLGERGADLVVSVDCGITAVEAARSAREAGLDLVITDHHNLPTGGELPDAILVHPRLPLSEYPFADLCGAGVAFKLAWRFATLWSGGERATPELQQCLMDMLPLAALGTIADVVPLVGENRVLARYGLQLMGETPLAGLRALIGAAGLEEGKIDAQAVGFRLAPRLNASGRLAHARDAVRMLTNAGGEEAAEIAGRLDDLNRERQDTERRIAEEAARRAEDAGMTGDDRRIIVLADDDWHPGVVGIVCSRLVERYGRPAILLRREGDVCRGSARSIDGYSIHEALRATSEHLTTFGGHDMAAGLSLPSDRLDAFVEALTAHAAAHIAVDEMVPAVEIDCDARLDEMSVAAVQRLTALAPFGRSNRKPMMLVRDVTLAEAPRQMGAEGKHLMLRVQQGDAEDRRVMRGVWWRRGELADDLAPGMRLDLVVEPRINEWRGSVNVEVQLADIRIR